MADGEVGKRRLVRGAVPDPLQVAVAADPENILQVRGLTVAYASEAGPVVAVDHVDLDLKRGEFLGIVGESGCGKSTLLYAIARLLGAPLAGEITAGQVVFKGRDLVSLTEKQLRACLRDLENLPPLPPAADRVDLGERFMFLDCVMLLHRDGLAHLELMVGRGAAREVTAPVARLLEEIDWDPVLRKANGWYDRLAETMRIKHRAERERQLDQIDEAECGHHYARAMASWGLVVALTGFRYDARQGLMTFAEVTQPTRWFWSTGSAWGTVQQTPGGPGGGRVELEVLSGSVRVEQLLAGERAFRPKGGPSGGNGGRGVSALINRTSPGRFANSAGRYPETSG